MRYQSQADQSRFICAERNLLPKLFLFSAGLWNANSKPAPQPQEVHSRNHHSRIDQSHGTPNHILFNNAVTGNLSSGVFPDKSYQVYLPILLSGNYAVTIQWTNVTSGAVSFYSCTANPSTFSSSNQNATQNFSC